MGKTVARALFIGVVSLAWAVAPSARADEASAVDLAKAREQFRRGVSLEAAEDYAGALEVFKEVALVRSSPQVRFHIAVCEEKLGRLVQALGSYKLAEIEADAAGAKDVSSAASEAAAALGPRIPKLTIRRGSGAAGAKVLLDGREVAGQSEALPIDPGAHAIRATAEGRRALDLETTLAAGESKEIEIVLAPEDAPVKSGPAVPAATAVPVAPVPSGAPASPLRIAGFVVGGAGIAGLAAAGALFGLRQSAMDALDAKCGADRQSCPESLRPTRDDGVLYSTASTAAWIAGAGAVALGGAFVLFAPKGKPEPSVAITPGGVTVTGRF